MEFAAEFKVLGIMADVGDVLAGDRLTMKNTDERKQDMRQQMMEIVEKGTLLPPVAQQVVGRIGFSSTQLFAKSGAAALWHLRRRAGSSGPASRVTPPLEAALRGWIRAIGEAPPRSLVFHSDAPPVIVFTDGCCEDGWAGIGAVMIDPLTRTAKAFGTAIPTDFFGMLMEDSQSEQLIGQAELLPVIAARLKWRTQLSQTGSRRIVYFVDNDAARFGLIKGYSPSRTSAWLLTEAWGLDEKSGAVSWIDRVPSKANIADGPSRLEFSRVHAVMGGRIKVVSPPDMWSELRRRRVIVGA